MKVETTPTSQEPQDAHVMSAWKFRLAVLAHRGTVYRVACGLLRSRADAEDAAQEAFMKYWEHATPIEKPREWLLKVVRNACLDRLRRASHWRSEPLDGVLEPADDRDPAWHFGHAEMKTRLDRAIDALPEPQRSLVVLFDQHGIEGAACARILELNVNQVKVYLHRARKRLRQALEQES